MKLKYILLTLAAWALLASCSDEESIVPAEFELESRYEFPQGSNEWDQIAKEIHEKHDVYLIYKGYSSLDFSRAWTVSSGKIYFGEDLTDENASVHMKFMKEHIFSYLDADLSRTVLPKYYFLIDSYRTEAFNSWSGKIDTAFVTNFAGGLDYWASSIYTFKAKTFPSDAEKLKEHRVRIMNQFFKSAIERGKITIPASFNDGFDYTKAFVTYPDTNPDYPLRRGFLGSLGDDAYNLGSIYNISNTNPVLNFLTYVFLGFRFTEAEFLVKYPQATYPLIYKKRLEVISYMKDKYKIDLQAIAKGPEL